MSKQKTPRELASRERQLVETVHRLGEASVAEVLDHLAEPPSYSAVRAMLGLLVEKGWLKQRRDGKRYLYRPATSRRNAQQGAIRRVMSTFFAGSAADAVAAVLDVSASRISDEELRRIREMIEAAERERE